MIGELFDEARDRMRRTLEGIVRQNHLHSVL